MLDTLMKIGAYRVEHFESEFQADAFAFGFYMRTIRSYEKSGFRYEGTQREVIFKEDQRWDIIDMGILKSDWEDLKRIPAETI